MQSVVDRNVVMRHTTLFPRCIFNPCLLFPFLRSATTNCVPVCSNVHLGLVHSQTLGRTNGYSERNILLDGLYTIW